MEQQTTTQQDSHGVTPPEQGDTMTVKELAAKIGMHEKTVYRLASAGQLPISTIRFGKAIMFSRREYERLFGIPTSATS